MVNIACLFSDYLSFAELHGMWHEYILNNKLRVKETNKQDKAYTYYSNKYTDHISH